MAGRRLVFSVGISYLAATAALLLVVFGGITEHLIPLFAIGAFLTFTLSQAGMVMHWRSKRAADGDRRTGIHLAINGLGAIATGIALVVIVVAKFAEGAWITLLVIPAAIALLKSIRRYYVRLEQKVHDPTPLDLRGQRAPIVLVAIEDWNQLADRAITFALTLSPHVVGVHLANLAGPEEGINGKLQERWERNVGAPARAAGLPAPELVILQAQYRAIQAPVLELACKLELRHPDRQVAVLVPELVKDRWYQNLLHLRRAQRLRAALIRHGGSRLTVISVPWYMEHRPLPVAATEGARPQPERPEPVARQSHAIQR